jgi:hypothetical protein
VTLRLFLPSGHHSRIRLVFACLLLQPSYDGYEKRRLVVDSSGRRSTRQEICSFVPPIPQRSRARKAPVRSRRHDTRRETPPNPPQERKRPGSPIVSSIDGRGVISPLRIRGWLVEGRVHASDRAASMVARRGNLDGSFGSSQRWSLKALTGRLLSRDPWRARRALADARPSVGRLTTSSDSTSAGASYSR